MRLIDAEKMHRELGELADTYKSNILGDKECMKIICLFAKRKLEEQETVDPVKHGHWIPKHRFDDDEYDEDEYDSFECSDCGYEVDFEEVWSFENYKKIYKANYCNCCGAKMDEVVSG